MDDERSCIGCGGGGYGRGRRAVMLVAVEVLTIMKRVVTVVEVIAMIKRAAVVVLATVITKVVVVEQ